MRSQEDRFDAYLNGELSDKERLDFEQSLEKSSDLAAAFAIHKAGVEMIKAKASLDLKKELKRHHARRFKYRKWISFLAAVIFLIALILGLRRCDSSTRQTVDSQELFARHYEDFSFLGTQRAGAQDSLIEKIGVFYKNAVYDSAALLLSRIKPEKDNIHLTLIKGCVSLHQGKYEDAMRNFRNAGLSENENYKYAGQWYQSLLELKRDNREEAVAILNILQEEESFYAEKAKTLLIDLGHQ